MITSKKKDKNNHDSKDLPPWFKNDDQDKPKLVIDQVKKHLKKMECQFSSHVMVEQGSVQSN